MVEMQTDKALDAMMDILPDMAAIMNDSEADEIIKRVKAQDATLEAGDAMTALVPMFARKYKAELFRIVAAFQGVTVEDVAKQDITKTLAVLAHGLRVYAGFFGCCLHMARSM